MAATPAFRRDMRFLPAASCRFDSAFAAARRFTPPRLRRRKKKYDVGNNNS